MEIFSLKLDNDALLTFFRWLSIFALAISLLSAIAVHFLAARVTRVMKAEISESNKTAGKAHERAEELRKDNSKLASVLKEEKDARLKLQQRMADRVLSEQEKIAIREAISTFPGQQILVFAVPTEAEPEGYAQQIVSVLEEARWKVDRGYGTLLGSPFYGLMIAIGNQPTKAVQSLLDGMRNAKLTVQMQPSPNLTADEVRLTVGLKDRR